jgi:hypothetical protein
MFKFKAKVYEINKGKDCQNAYLATVKQNITKRLKLKEREGLLIKIKNQQFVTAVRKNSNSLVFTVPMRIGKNLKLKEEITFGLLLKNTNKTPNDKKGFLNLKKIISSKTIRNYPIYVFDLNDNLLFWIYSRGNKPFILPKHIPIQKEKHSLFELMGAFLCEGFKARKKARHRDRFSFSNAEISEIKWFLNSCEKILNINKKEWNAQILFPKTDKIKDLKKYWSDSGIKSNKISVVKNEKILAKQGVCILSIYGSTLAEVFNSLFEYSKKMCLQSFENSLNMFRGFSRGDMGITHGKNGALKVISVTTENESNIKLFIKICNVLGIRTSKYYKDSRGEYWTVNITHYNEFNKIIKLNGITHKKRKLRLYSGFLKNNKSTRYKYLKSVVGGANISRKSSEFLDLSIITTRAMFARYSKENYLKYKVKKRYNTKEYSLTNKGEKFLNFYNELEKEISGKNG